MAEGFVGRLMHRAQSMHSKLESIKEKSEETMGRAMMLAEVTAANAGFSYANGRFGNNGLGGVDQALVFLSVPADLAAAVALGGLGLVGTFGKYSEHAFNLGVGSLQSFTSRNLLSMGLAAGAKAAQTSGMYVHAAGALPYGNPYGSGAYAPHYSHAQG